MEQQGTAVPLTRSIFRNNPPPAPIGCAVLHSSHGEVYFDPSSGVVRRIDETGDPDALSDIVRVNLDTCAPHLNGKPVKAGDEFDILWVGFWTDTNQYVPPDGDTKAA